ncbi:acyl-CoA thioesterase [Janibacter melonis]|uniref:acyl-CoA thioesterase n=1 Tax=Janibacter melonis TaxID=262209 RepID=UPI001CD253F2|nr:acyl-CoA thioesterase domain-containing protein [Janibacter melonis]
MTARAALPTLADLLALEQVDDSTWRGMTDGVPLPQLFGGQLVAQSLVAAGRSVDEHVLPHSIHTSFLRGGLPDEPVDYRVEVLRDGRQTATREVSAWQGERLVCRSTVSSTSLMGGLAHSRPAPATEGLEAAVDLHVLAELDGGLGEFWDDFSAFEIRVEPPLVPADHWASAPQNVWMRCTQDLPDDPLSHRAAIAYASDLMLMSTAVTPHGHTTGHETSLARRWWAVSLDHAVWFHRDADAGDWLLFEHSTSAAGGSRALVDAAVFAPDGTQTCRITQEALVRPARPHQEI